MATTLYFRSGAGTQRGQGSNNLSGTAANWYAGPLSTSRGATATSSDAVTVAGPTNGIEYAPITISGQGEWISEPLAADVTIANTITFNIRGLESDMMANAGPQVVIERLDKNCEIVSTVVNSEHGTEFGTSEAAHNWTAAPTSTAFAKGERIRIRVAHNDVGTMAGSYAGTFYFDGPTAAASGDSYVTFTENFSFMSAAAGTTIYPTTTASDIDPGGAGTDTYKAWTSRGAGVTTAVRNTATGDTAPLQWTTSAGGNLIEWYTPQLQAFTLSGRVDCNIRALESNLAADGIIRVEIARVNSDGSSPAVYGTSGMQTAVELTTSEAAYTCWVAGADLSISQGQRLRFRAYLDDAYQTLTSTHTATFYYAGTSGGASGDSYLTFTQTLTEYAPSGDVTATPATVAAIASVPSVSVVANALVAMATVAALGAVPAVAVGTQFPVVRSASTGAETGNTTTHSVILPATIEAGDLLLVFMTFDGLPTVTWDNSTAGTWVVQWDTNDGAQVTGVGYAKVADGTEDGKTLSIGTDASEQSVYRATAYQGWQGTLANGLKKGTPATGSNDTPDPPSVDVWGATEDISFIAICHTDFTVTVSSYPANYTVNQFNDTSGGGSGCGLGTAKREFVTGSAEDPGTYTLSAGDEWIAQTIAIRPSTGDAEPTPATVAAPASVPAATVVADANVAPATTAAVAAVPAVTLASNQVVSPSTVAGIGAVPAATIRSAAVATPATVAAVGAVPAVTLASNQVVSPSTVSAVGSVPTANPLAAGVASPAAVAAIGGVPPPTVLAAALVAPASADAVATVPTPTVVVGGDDATATPATVAAVASAPTVTLRSDRTATPATVAGVAGVPAVTVSGGAIVAPAAVAAISAVPAVTFSSDQTASLASVDAIASVPAPTVLGAAIVTPATVAIGGAVPAATPSSDQTVTPSTVATVGDVPAATVLGAAVVTPATVAAVGSVPTPTVIVGGDAVAPPATVAATASVPATTLSASAVVTPSSVATVAAVPVPTFASDQLATPSTVAGLGAVPALSVLADATVAPSTVAAIAAVPTVTLASDQTATPGTAAALGAVASPTVLGAAVVSAATVAATASVPTPTVVGTGGVDITATPSTVAAVAAVPAVTTLATAVVPASTVAAKGEISHPTDVSATSVIEPSTVAATGAIPAATLAGSARVTPATTAAIAAAGAPTVVGNATVSPATVAATASVPQPTVSLPDNDVTATPATVAAIAAVPKPRVPLPFGHLRGRLGYGFSHQSPHEYRHR